VRPRDDKSTTYTGVRHCKMALYFSIPVSATSESTTYARLGDHGRPPILGPNFPPLHSAVPRERIRPQTVPQRRETGSGVCEMRSCTDPRLVGARDQDLVFVRIARLFPNALAMRIAGGERSRKRGIAGESVMRQPPFEEIAIAEIAGLGVVKNFCDGDGPHGGFAATRFHAIAPPAILTMSAVAAQG